ncbi:hypothetical protein [Bacillus suaedae]|uniref:Uncharacterized protein n=1 Tax=Halalkalibacter suaedae TaxID=2822140 RepID=A0A941AMB7_9BACI|nr:hypothetical protein [Bacillus suaedae]MBP3950335.1 hypothetical protein [Bacillus suaedae]
MPKFIAKSYLTHKGNIVQPGNEIELTEAQAKRLGEKVEPVGAEGTQQPSNAEKKGLDKEAEFKKLTADEQKQIISDLGGDLNELSNEDKRVAFYLENQQ